MIVALHIFCTIYLALLFIARIREFYGTGYTIQTAPKYALYEFVWMAVVGYMLYLMWAGK